MATGTIDFIELYGLWRPLGSRLLAGVLNKKLILFEGHIKLEFSLSILHTITKCKFDHFQYLHNVIVTNFDWFFHFCFHLIKKEVCPYRRFFYSTVGLPALTVVRVPRIRQTINSVMFYDIQRIFEGQ